jgi:hypothetical protein
MTSWPAVEIGKVEQLWIGPVHLGHRSAEAEEVLLLLQQRRGVVLGLPPFLGEDLEDRLDAIR